MNEAYPLALPAGTVLAGQYVLQKVLGQGGFGITYEAKDHKTGERVAIKEFFPDSMATRTQTTVMPFSGERGESYDYGKECFLQEAETLAKFIGNENIVRIYSYFEENGTAYFVMDFIEGTSFDDYLKQNGGRLPFDKTAEILIPVMDALNVVHSKGIIHRDVTPDNIYITKDGTVKLLDFGAARYSLGDKSCSLDVVLKHGFAPKEQYTRRGKQGPYTDVYALGATFYFALTGRRPPDSIDRMDEDDLVPPSTLGVKLSKAAESAILKALDVQPQNRFQSMEAFKNAMLSIRTDEVQKPSRTVEQRFFTEASNSDPGADYQAVLQETKTEPQLPSADTVSAGSENKRNNKKLAILIAAAAGVLVIVIVAGVAGAKRSSAYVPTDYDEATIEEIEGEEPFDNTIPDYDSDWPEIEGLPDSTGTDNDSQEGKETEETNEEKKANRNLYPVIKGNTVNNLLNYSYDSISGEYREAMVRFCYSECGDFWYAIKQEGVPTAPSKTEAVVIDRKKGSVNAIPELKQIPGIMSLLVSNEYYFAYSGSTKTFYCVDRQSGEILGTREVEKTKGTFMDNGYFVYMQETDGGQRLYKVPAGDLGGEFNEPEECFTFGSEDIVKGLIAGNGNTVYVFLEDTSDKNNYIGWVDLSERKGVGKPIGSEGTVYSMNFIEDSVYYVYWENNRYFIKSINMNDGSINDVYDCKEGTSYVWGLGVFNHNGDNCIDFVSFPDLVWLNLDTGESDIFEYQNS